MLNAVNVTTLAHATVYLVLKAIHTIGKEDAVVNVSSMKTVVIACLVLNTSVSTHALEPAVDWLRAPFQDTFRHVHARLD